MLDLDSMSETSYADLVRAYKKATGASAGDTKRLARRKDVAMLVKAELSSLKPPDASDLKAAGVNVRRGADPASRGYDLQERYNRIPNHAIFLYADDDNVLDEYIRNNWNSLDGLSGDFCDIHPSISQLHGDEDVYTQLEKLKNIPGLGGGAIKFSQLPALHMWSDLGFITISLKDFDTAEKLSKAFRAIFDVVRDERGALSAAGAERIRQVMFSFDQEPSSRNGQSIEGAHAGRDISQTIININYPSRDGGREEGMSGNGKKSSAQGGQSIEDAKAGGNISQSSQRSSDQQTMRRVESPGDISQNKSEPSTLQLLGWGKASGFGVIALVVIFAIWIVYKYIASAS
jgi:hypothetical protein